MKKRGLVVGVLAVLLVMVMSYLLVLVRLSSRVFEGIVNKEVLQSKNSVLQLQQLLRPFNLVTNLPLLIGLESDRHYIVLFQNNMELRPTGGFMGSYASLWFRQGKLTDVEIQDIYVPDGQIKGYVKEPDPIRKYLFNEEHPGWRLRDANWNPDFIESSKAINWFFREGNLPQVDGYIAINLFPIVDLLRATGGVYLADYNLTVTADSFYGEAQRHAEQGFFPGSTQKKDFLQSVGTRLLQTRLSPFQIARIIYTNLREKHIFISIPDVFSTAWHRMGWDGSLKDTKGDYLMIVEANVGSSKSNCCIDRALSDTVSFTGSQANHLVTLTYKNNNPPIPLPPDQWGGGYKNYLRLVVPLETQLQSIEVDGQMVDSSQIDEATVSAKKSFGFLVLTEGGKSGQVVARYSVPLVKPYSLLFQKQSGIEAWPATFSINNQITKERVKTDRLYTR